MTVGLLNPFRLYINKMLIDYYDDSNRKITINYFYKNLLRPVQVELVGKGYNREIIEAERITQLGKN